MPNKVLTVAAHSGRLVVPLCAKRTTFAQKIVNCGRAMQKCLIVDDTNVIRKVTQAILTDMNYTVLEAENTDDALKICQTEQPNVVIVDWHIPHNDSLEFIETLRSTFTGRRPFVVYCTTEKDPDLISKAVEAGADDYLLKPFDRATLVNKFSEIKRAA